MLTSCALGHASFLVTSNTLNDTVTDAINKEKISVLAVLIIHIVGTELMGTTTRPRQQDRTQKKNSNGQSAMAIPIPM